MDLNDFTEPLQLNDTTRLQAIFDPALRCFRAQLWKADEPAGLLGLDEVFTHPDDVLEAINEFLAEEDQNPLTEQQMGRFGGMLIMAKGGPDAEMLRMAIAKPDAFLPLA
ncbi:hypothetical protein [Streptomyces viridochromogenes]|uniref:hypothetical protein n=1 Tax=Streptomyces viridochromogenes TaxID=1938 RepID=UPI0031DDC1A4